MQNRPHLSINTNNMLQKVLSQWYRRLFSDNQAIVITILAVVAVLTIYLIGHILLPVFVAFGVAYLLEGAIAKMVNWGIRRIFAIGLIFLLFIFTMILCIIGIVPVLSNKMANFFTQLPTTLVEIQDSVFSLISKHTGNFSSELIMNVRQYIEQTILSLQQTLFSVDMLYHLGSFFVVYVFIVPVIAFFLLKDKAILLSWIRSYLPEERTLLTQMWHAFDIQIGNYIRGKFYHMLIIMTSSFILYLFCGLNFASVLAILTGLSVLIPYIGAIVVALPVALIGYFQWGATSHFFILMAGYGVLQFLDGNLLVPILFSKLNNLHPVAIILAVLFFAGMFGFWGALLAIPLATLIKIILNLWPTYKELHQEEQQRTQLKT